MKKGGKNMFIIMFSVYIVVFSQQNMHIVRKQENLIK